MALPPTELFPYGILTERSDLRAHVGVLARTIYVFRTPLVREFLESRRALYPIRDAYQDGVRGRTAEGVTIPWREVPGIRALRFTSGDWAGFAENDSTSEKGRKAVALVIACMKLGRFPLFVDAAESDQSAIQIAGTDIVVHHSARIQVKCDWRAGEGHPKCSGNLFLQLAERNPLRRT